MAAIKDCSSAATVGVQHGTKTSSKDVENTGNNLETLKGRGMRAVISSHWFIWLT